MDRVSGTRSWPVGPTSSAAAAPLLPVSRRACPRFEPLIKVGSSIINPGGSRSVGRSVGHSSLSARVLPHQPCARSGSLCVGRRCLVWNRRAPEKRRCKRAREAEPSRRGGADDWGLARYNDAKCDLRCQAKLAGRAALSPARKALRSEALIGRSSAPAAFPASLVPPLALCARSQTRTTTSLLAAQQNSERLFQDLARPRYRFAGPPSRPNPPALTFQR